jgi:hypothetical protein
VVRIQNPSSVSIVIVQLCQIARIQQGLQFRGGVKASPSGRFRVIQIRDFDANDQLVANWQESLVRIEEAASTARYAVRQGDVLFLARGPRNFAWAVPELMQDVVAVGYFFILQPDPSRILPGYLAWYLNEEPARSYIREFASQGTHMPIVNRSQFEQLEIPLPPLKVQGAIAELESLRRREARLMRRLEVLRRREISLVGLRAVSEFAPKILNLLRGA